MAQVVAKASNKRKRDNSPSVVPVFQDFENHIVKALHNPVLLSKIMPFLSIPDLKKARKVCQKWNDVGAEQLERRAVLRFPQPWRKFPKRLFNSVKIMRLDASFGEKLLTELYDLFREEGKNVKHLILNNVVSDGVEIYKRIFEAMTEVESLCVNQFKVNYGQGSLADARKLFQGKSPNLKHLQLGDKLMATLDKQWDFDTEKIWIKQLFQTGITTLKFDTNSSGIFAICNGALSADKNEHELLQKLECVEMEEKNETARIFFLNVGHPLKKIDLGTFETKRKQVFVQQQQLISLKQVLEKNAASLEALKMSVHLNYGYFPRKSDFQWPFLPKLKELSVGGTRNSTYVEDTTLEILDVFHLADLFKNSLTLENKMSNLEVLSLNFQFDRAWTQPFYKFVFPKEEEFPQIKKIHVANCSRCVDKKKQQEVIQASLLRKLIKRFPNAKITFSSSTKFMATEA